MADHAERKVTERDGYRSRAQVDRDRILYSTAFSRLAEVTQVVSPDRGHVFHNRLTHSLKVAQLARRLAEKLRKVQPAEAAAVGGLDPDVAEASALAHDLGHPPFGHTAETELDSCVREAGLEDGFEGNAQSFRIVTKLAVSDAMDTNDKPIPGLNLTRATLNGILKYPWLRGGNPCKSNKWGAYETERGEFEWARVDQPSGAVVRSAEAELMDWADDITYAVHDLNDFFCVGQIPLERLSAEKGTPEQRSFFEEVFQRRIDLSPRRDELEQTFWGILDLFPIDRQYLGTHEQRCLLWQFATVLITRYVDAIKLDPAGKESSVSIAPNARDEVEMLKELTWHYVILKSDLATVQHGQRVIIRDVFDTLHKASTKPSSSTLFPPGCQEALRAAAVPGVVTRVVADYISSMTEREITSIHRRLTGRSL